MNGASEIALERKRTAADARNRPLATATLMPVGVT